MDLHAWHVAGGLAGRGDGDRGATAVEYALLVALIAAVIALAVGTVGGQVWTIFTNYLASF